MGRFRREVGINQCNQAQNTKFVEVNVHVSTHIIVPCQVKSVGSQHEQGKDEEKVVEAHRIETCRQLYDKGEKAATDPGFEERSQVTVEEAKVFASLFNHRPPSKGDRIGCIFGR